MNSFEGRTDALLGIVREPSRQRMRGHGRPVTCSLKAT